MTVSLFAIEVEKLLLTILRIVIFSTASESTFIHLDPDLHSSGRQITGAVQQSMQAMAQEYDTELW